MRVARATPPQRPPGPGHTGDVYWCGNNETAPNGDRLVYGAVNPRLGAVESSMRDPASAEHPYHTFEIAGGVLADEASELMKLFFRKRRNGEVDVEKPPEGRMPASGSSANVCSSATGSGEHENARNIGD